ncbi:hypothetical protein E2C01_072983 [Portunus trituberculatus]|uniref:Uncharacterized protein n=1 Tax=Portunus trituberculatus TaxID=210409 RepID=A0A5B7I9D4_PORTR|nr:hypothetical protein [Portunus trituberculatus]
MALSAMGKRNQPGVSHLGAAGDSYSGRDRRGRVESSGFGQLQWQGLQGTSRVSGSGAIADSYSGRDHRGRAESVT